MVPLRWTKWLSKLKIEKPFKRYLLPGQWADFKIISQKCSLDDSLLKLLKWFRSAEQNWPSKWKIEKPFKPHFLLGQWADFKIISQECSLDDPLPKLLKWFCSIHAISHTVRQNLTEISPYESQFPEEFSNLTEFLDKFLRDFMKK